MGAGLPQALLHRREEVLGHAAAEDLLSEDHIVLLCLGLEPDPHVAELAAAEMCIRDRDTYESQEYVEEGLVTGEASGFFISADGLAVTNYHSIEDAVYATATLSTGDVYELDRVIYYDPDIDIAVIRISRTALEGHDTTAFAALDIAPSGTGDLRVGDTVYAIGNPLGLGLAVSSGVVSATAREVERYALPLSLIHI